MKTTEGAPIWGEGIRALRGIRGRMTQEELATLAGVKQSTISRLERGEGGASDATRVRIAKALDIEPHILFPYLDPDAEQAS